MESMITEVIKAIFARSRNEVFTLLVRDHMDENEKLRRASFELELKRNICDGFPVWMLEDVRLRSTKTLEESEQTLQKLIDSTYRSLKITRLTMFCQIGLLLIGFIFSARLFTLIFIIGVCTVQFLFCTNKYLRAFYAINNFYWNHGLTEAVLKQADYRGYQCQDYNLDIPIFY